MAKKKVKRFRVHAVMEVAEDRRLEMMFSSTLERATLRVVVDGIPKRPYMKSDIFYDENGAYVTILLGPATAGVEMSYAKIYLDSFKRVRG